MQNLYGFCMDLYKNCTKIGRFFFIGISEYVGDISSNKEKRTIKSWKEVLWKLAKDLKNAFNLPNPLTHDLFKNAKEMNEEGFKHLFFCYNNGIDRLNAILYQDVYKTES